MKSKLIVFEGIDHTGKTTQIERAEGWMRLENIEFEAYREPGGTATGERIRDLLLDKKRIEMVPLTELFLFFASRAQLVEEKIRPALDRGANVILDRYWYSTAAYQGSAIRGGVSSVIAVVNLLGFPQPDLVVCLDGDPEKLSARKSGPGDRIEAKGIDYQKQVRSIYHGIALTGHGRFHMVDATRGIEDVHADILQLLKGLP